MSDTQLAERDTRLAELVEMAADEPRKARAGVTRLARPLPAEKLAPFFERACRRFAAAAANELATWAFTQARKADKNHPSLVDMDRLHQVFLEFTPMGVVAPTALRNHVALMGERLAPEEAYRRYNEILDAAFAVGLVPYARIYPDARKLARAAKIKKARAEDDLTARLLRTGALRYASHAVWNAAHDSLARLTEGDEEFQRLLIAAAPDTDAEDDPHLAEEIQRMWLDALVRAQAGVHLTEEWFVEYAGRCRPSVLARLTGQAGVRLVPDGRAETGPAADLLSDARPGGGRAHGLQDPSLWATSIVDTADLAAFAERDPAEFARLLDAFVVDLGHYANIDYSAALHRMWQEPAIRNALREKAAAWKAEAASPSLPVVSRAVHRLLRLADHDYAELDPAFTDGLQPADPVDALRTALRRGIPEELHFPHATWGPRARGTVELVQHGDYLTAVVGRHWARVYTPDGQIPDLRMVKGSEDFVLWYDGEEFLDSLRVRGSLVTFHARIDGPRLVLTFDPATRNRRPDGPTESEVTFPGADEPSRVVFRDGVISVIAPGGTVTARLPYQLRQKLTPERPAPVYPPGWWPHLRPVDPDGSAALRDLDRERAERLVEAALAGRGPARDAWPKPVPEISEPALRDGVIGHARDAAQCVLNIVRLRERLGLPQPAQPPTPLRTRPDLPAGGALAALPALRWVEGVVRDAMEIPAPSEPRPVRVVPLPDPLPGLSVSFGATGVAALDTVWPWKTERTRRPVLEGLNAWANTMRGDGSGRWRLLRLTPEDGMHREDASGEVWRTPRGVLFFGHYSRHDKMMGVWEYAPDGVFDPVELPGWRELRTPVPQGWGGADRVSALRRLLGERGPLHPDPAWVHELAERTGMRTTDAAMIVFGIRYYTFTHYLPREAFPAEILAFYPEGGRHEVPYSLQDAVTECLMPDDPADLWGHGPDIARAAARYLELRDAPV
ncbi:hypothetical protein Acsp04_23890 [Actinomadura sp. NBRC 104425]|uniref:hypothetical protein n=1 Tax=Actinomadura sp. NBRC 104425 TaxID=3032204 RepID=UPI0024A13476|nr:hypothetical protein [Actinomadura sp. NBRC 104425]GLZ12154.1 hypothetical protein Acsp04_23890 [Actinomadura sp. NBRC 104425]